MTTALNTAKSDLREEPRASLYLAASLYYDGLSMPVKIRNLSTTGALIELPSCLAPGGVIQLVRGSLIVHALVAWSEGSRCGLRFSGIIDVQRWRGLPGNAEQQRVDDIVRTVKAGALPAKTAATGSWNLSNEDRPLSADLELARQLLTQLGEQLAGDDHLVASHGPDLQKLDIAMQVIGAVEAILSGQSDFAADAQKIVGLRKSADQALAAVRDPLGVKR